ncbi:unnamed protein product [Protopolystoma xenopodis]|uniref:Uncharacterized protein n=1 Tax=Protopolystoma xenopodis TaxID=117903 RepID=A0A3S5C3F4_9PLAT|nr:unnamed protein product [Protopolystoma xenopodis]
MKRNNQLAAFGPYVCISTASSLLIMTHCLFSKRRPPDAPRSGDRARRVLPVVAAILACGQTCAACKSGFHLGVHSDMPVDYV